MNNQYRRLDRKDLIDHSKLFEDLKINTDNLTPADYGTIALIEEGDISITVITHTLKLVDRKLGLDVMYNIDPDLTEELIINDLTYTNMFLHFAMTYPGFRRILMHYFVQAVTSLES